MGIHINGLVQERRNSIANALELGLSCINPSICSLDSGLVPDKWQVIIQPTKRGTSH